MFAPNAACGAWPIVSRDRGRVRDSDGKGGVGKTTISRTLLDYFSANNVPTRAFDTESPRGTLKRFHPEITEIVDMTTTSDQMKIFDTLSASPSVTVIDVRAGLLSPALASLRDIGFLDAAKSGQ